MTKEFQEKENALFECGSKCLTFLLRPSSLKSGVSILPTLNVEAIGYDISRITKNYLKSMFSIFQKLFRLINSIQVFNIRTFLKLFTTYLFLWSQIK